MTSQPTRHHITQRYSLTMSSLIPTPRTDKNGRTVTRHLKPQSTSTTKSSTPIPPLTLSAPKDHATLVSGATAALTNLLYPEGTPAKDLAKITTVLTTYSDATLNRIQQQDWNRKPAYHFSVGIITTWDETKANDYMAATTALREYEPDGVPPLHYNSWQHYPELHPLNKNGDYPKERLNQLTALYIVTEHMIANGKEPYYWNDLTNDIEFTYLNDDDQLRNFLLNPGPDHNRDDITRIITTHHTYDPGKIKAMLDLGVQSMTSGVL